MPFSTPETAKPWSPTPVPLSAYDKPWSPIPAPLSRFEKPWTATPETRETLWSPIPAPRDTPWQPFKYPEPLDYSKRPATYLDALNLLGVWMAPVVACTFLFYSYPEIETRTQQTHLLMAFVLVLSPAAVAWFGFGMAATLPKIQGFKYGPFWLAAVTGTLLGMAVWMYGIAEGTSWAEWVLAVGWSVFAGTLGGLSCSYIAGNGVQAAAVTEKKTE